MKEAPIDLDSLVQLRQEIHKNPELSGKEEKTAQRIVKFLKKYHPDEIIENLGKTGVAAIYQGKQEGPTILIRCELDALPIRETNEFDYKSNISNVSHKCGHDGHMTIVAGLASIFHKHPIESGKVVLLFQPAEENGMGAKAVLADSKFKKIEPDFVFALHNLPRFPEGVVVYKSGIFTAAVKSIIIKLTGKTSHAAEPEKGLNPALAISEIIQKARELEVENTADKDFALITPIHLSMGKIAYGISAGDGSLRFTIRTWNNERINQVSNELEKAVEAIAKKHSLSIKISWTQEFAANENDVLSVDIIEKAAKMSNMTTLKRSEPFKWGEDFGLFTKKYKGAMFGLGAGEDLPALHNPDYDFPDSIIPHGVKIFYSIIREVLN